MIQNYSVKYVKCTYFICGVCLELSFLKTLKMLKIVHYLFNLALTLLEKKEEVVTA